MKSLFRFVKGMLKMPLPWQLWLSLLAVVNVVVPLFFAGRVEAQVVLGTMLVNMLLMTGLTRLTGFSRLLGLGHFPWFCLLFYLWFRLDQIPAADAYGIWVRALMAVNALSLVIDTVDVVRYLAGDRKETVQGL